LARKGITVLDHPPYSPDLAPADRHDTIQDIQRECTAVLNAIPQKEYSDCFQKLVNRFQLYIDSEGDYFEYKECNFENNSRLLFLMNTVLTEPGHTV
jgi:hypothetical protein